MAVALGGLGHGQLVSFPPPAEGSLLLPQPSLLVPLPVVYGSAPSAGVLRVPEACKLCRDTGSGEEWAAICAAVRRSK